ncbi:hypothetical protein IQ249_16975 [Lusitaniella coriacea LEGE 07157]|uniref:EfeO-type cupredoxin-like domain-containing protein n=1 Tax=Lusitaniella coriacea LEGE 07157 TaxID=945747 RepID=A0A8J7DYI1_9CYAN|nr:hypothetical protein [Lusitaniella coriacea LEGE 07157]
MKYVRILSGGLFLAAIAGCTANKTGIPALTESSDTAQVVTLTQTGCQFLETEGKDYQYKTQNEKDCKQINSKTLTERKQQFKPLQLKAGKYVFRVTNRDVPYELGFYLRGAGASGITLPKTSGGGLTTGTTQEYEITLTPGQYVFSCPLNPTPDYPIIVN